MEIFEVWVVARVKMLSVGGRGFLSHPETLSDHFKRSDRQVGECRKEKEAAMFFDDNSDQREVFQVSHISFHTIKRGGQFHFQLIEAMSSSKE